MVNSKGYSAVHYAAYHGNKQNLELVGFALAVVVSRITPASVTSLSWMYIVCVCVCAAPGDVF